MGDTDNSVVVVTADNGTEGFTWPDGGTTPVKGWKGIGTEGGSLRENEPQRITVRCQLLDV